MSFTPLLARKVSGVEDEGPLGIMAGAGALGSEILDLWVRSGWGRWTVIDPDRVRPHNLARHRASEEHVGTSKATAVKKMADNLFRDQPSRVTAIVDSATNDRNISLRESLGAAEFVVDATTTLDFPRSLAASASIRRAASVFITPSGRDAVILLEDTERRVKLDSLEAQYYRHVISSQWGATHLEGNAGHLWTGASCRDLSAIIPNDALRLHASNLAGLVRRYCDSPPGRISIFRYEPMSGAIVAEHFVPVAPLSVSSGEDTAPTVVWDEVVRNKIRDWRLSKLPSETGGVLLGYWDLVLERVYIVDALPAPDDSMEERVGFIRGVEGLADAVRSAHERSGKVVGYVGEWHSHPRHHSTQPSPDDFVLLAHLASGLAYEGLAAVMLIVGDQDERWILAKLQGDADDQ